TGPETRSFCSEEGENRSRTGAPSSVTMHDMGLATVIGTDNRDSSGKALSSSMRSTVERLRTWDRRSQAHESADRNLRQALNELRRYSDKLTVSEAITERAAYIYRKCLERGLVRGRSITAMLAGSLHAAWRDVERTLESEEIGQKDVAEAAGVTAVTSRNRYKSRRSFLGI